MYLYLGLYETRFLLLTYSIENLSSTRKLDWYQKKYVHVLPIGWSKINEHLIPYSIFFKIVIQQRSEMSGNK